MGRGWVCFGIALWLAACGGRSTSDGSDDGRGARESRGDDDGEAPPDGDGNGSALGDDVALAGCKLGPRDVGQSGQDCLWLGEQRCYSEKLDACACICPRDHESICSSEFASERGRTPVYCY